MTDTTATVDTTAATATVAAPKAPSKKSLALAIFAAKLAQRKEGLFTTNKEFRAAVLSTIEKDLGVSTASAATMYNAAKKEAEATDTTVVLGRDPKKEKPAKGTGKRGRPAGSKNKAKTEEVAPAEQTAETAVSKAVSPTVEVTVDVAPTETAQTEVTA